MISRCCGSEPTTRLDTKGHPENSFGSGQKCTHRCSPRTRRDTGALGLRVTSPLPGQGSLLGEKLTTGWRRANTSVFPPDAARQRSAQAPNREPPSKPRVLKRRKNLLPCDAKQSSPRTRHDTGAPGLRAASPLPGQGSLLGWSCFHCRRIKFDVETG